MNTETSLSIARMLAELEKNLQARNPLDTAEGSGINPSALNQTAEAVRVLSQLFNIAQRGGEKAQPALTAITTARTTMETACTAAINNAQELVRQAVTEMISGFEKISAKADTQIQKIKTQFGDALLDAALAPSASQAPAAQKPAESLTQNTAPVTESEIVGSLLHESKTKTKWRYESIIRDLVKKFLAGSADGVSIRTERKVTVEAMFQRNVWFTLVKTKPGMYRMERKT